LYGHYFEIVIDDNTYYSRGGDLGGRGGTAPKIFEVGDVPCIGSPQFLEK